MTAKRGALGAAQEELERLYLQPPERFTRTRDELARSLRERGEREAAQEVKKLRRPSVAAWLVNQLGLREPGAVESLLAAGKRLRELEDAMLAGKGNADELRAAAAEERDAIQELVAAARRIADHDDRKVNEAIFDRVAETLQAASADEELAESVRAGRVEREAKAATIGVSSRAPAPARGRRRPREDDRAERNRAQAELDAASRDLERAEARRERAQDEVDKQTERLKDARADLAKAKREATRAAAALRRAEGQAKKER
jgi:hypothetical protein